MKQKLHVISFYVDIDNTKWNKKWKWNNYDIISKCVATLRVHTVKVRQHVQRKRYNVETQTIVRNGYYMTVPRFPCNCFHDQRK